MTCDGVTRHKRRYTHQPMFRSQMKDIDVIVDGVGEVRDGVTRLSPSGGLSSLVTPSVTSPP